MTKIVRETSPYGRPCNELGPLVKDTPTLVHYGLRDGRRAYASKKCQRIHLEPCRSCRDHERSRFPEIYQRANQRED